MTDRRHFLLFYDLAPDYRERRDALRAEHRELAHAAVERGELVLAGALEDPRDAAVLLFSCDSDDVVRRFVEADAYVRGGLVTSWRIRQWKTIVGPDAVAPDDPAPGVTPP